MSCWCCLLDSGLYFTPTVSPVDFRNLAVQCGVKLSQAIANARMGGIQSRPRSLAVKIGQAILGSPNLFFQLRHLGLGSFNIQLLFQPVLLLRPSDLGSALLSVELLASSIVRGVCSATDLGQHGRMIVVESRPPCGFLARC